MVGTVTRFTSRRKLLSLMVRQDLKIAYSRYRLGFVWALGEPFLMALLMWGVFTFIFAGGRGIGLQPFIVFLITGLYPFAWLSLSNRLGTKVFRRYGDVLETSPLPLVVWPLRVVLYGMVEFLLSIPVIFAFILIGRAGLTWGVVLFPVGMIMQFALCLGMAMLGAGLSLRWPDVEVFTQMVNRAFFWTSPILWAQKNFPEPLQPLLYLNPFHGVLDMYRASVWPDEVLNSWANYAVSGAVILAILGVGAWLLQGRGLQARRV